MLLSSVFSTSVMYISISNQSLHYCHFSPHFRFCQQSLPLNCIFVRFLAELCAVTAGPACSAPCHHQNRKFCSPLLMLCTAVSQSFCELIRENVFPAYDRLLSKCFFIFHVDLVIVQELCYSLLFIVAFVITIPCLSLVRIVAM